MKAQKYLFINYIIIILCFFSSCYQFPHPNHAEETLSRQMVLMKVLSPQYAKNFSTISPSATDVIKKDQIKIAVTSATHLAFLKALQFEGHVVAVDRWTKTLIPELSFSEDFGAVYYSDDPESLIHSNADLVFTYDFDGHDSANMRADLKSMLKNKMKFFPLYEFKEEHPLGRLEWIKVVGLALNLQNTARKYFDHEVELYELLKKNQMHLEKAVFITGEKNEHTWKFSQGFVNQIVLDAGGQLISKDQSLSYESLLALVDHCKKNQKKVFWLTHLPLVDYKSLLAIDPLYKELTTKIENNIIIINPIRQKQYWFDGLIRPHELLESLIQKISEGPRQKNTKEDWYVRLQ